MDQQRHLLPFSYPHHQLSLDELSRPRQPLIDSAGNAQLHALASVGIYQLENKARQHRADRPPMYAIPPTLPSQPARPPLGSTLDLRKQNNRRRRFNRHSRNPIIDSPQYQAYRARMNRDGNPEDAKWPEILEIAFLDGKSSPHIIKDGPDSLKLSSRYHPWVGGSIRIRGSHMVVTN